MKRSITTYVLIGTILVAGVFGFTSTNHLKMDCNPASPASMCPPSQIGMVLHHISTYGNFLSGIISSSTTSIISIILGLAFAFVWGLTALFRPSFVRFRKRASRESSLVHRIKLHKWLSLFENSPAFI